MYDATTRNTYADLFKTAEAKVPARLRTELVKIAIRHPAVRDALVASPAVPPVKETR
jgi:hypothetical protein